MADKTLSPEILKLMDKLAQNPTSRLFVPLAEEYLKSDMVEEAMIVLSEGIKNHPNYVAARVMLGKIYLQKNQVPEAQTQFEQVIMVNPENILAHKKLAVIYQGQGQFQRALESCKKVLKIDPSDKEAKGMVDTLEKELASASQPKDEAEPSNEPVLTESIVAAESPLAADSSMTSPADSVPPPEPVSAPEPANNVVEEAPAEVSIQPEPEPTPAEVAPPAEASFGEILKVPEEPIAPSILKEIPAAVAPESTPVTAASPDPIPMESGSSVEDWEGDRTVVAGFEMPSAPNASSAGDKKEEPLLSTTLASLYMSQGHYKEAAEVYEKLLAQDASDEESRQGLEKALRHLAAAKGESVSNSNLEDSKVKKARRLQSWLDSIRKKE